MLRLLLFAILLAGMAESFAQKAIDKKLLLELVNQARSKSCRCGGEKQKATTPLQWDEALERAAEKHANDMAAGEFFSHTGSDQSSVSDRVDREQFEWRAVGENIAMGHQDEKMVVEGWMNSPGHCKNIMSPDFKYMGVAVSADGKYWVQVFADKLE